MVILIAIAFFVTSCITTKDVTQIKGDVIGFSDDIKQTNYKKKKNDNPEPKSEPFFLMSEDKTNPGTPKLNIGYIYMREYIDELKPGMNTALYYALDKGLDRVKNVRKKHMQKSEATKYYTVVFTDGLDNISNQLGKIRGNDGQWQNKYDKKLQKKMNMVVKNKTHQFESWVIVYYGKDLENSGWTQEDIKTKIKYLSGDNDKKKKFDEKMDRVIIIDENQRKLENLAVLFRDEFTTQSFKFYIPKGYLGRNVKMELSDEKNNMVSFTGDFIKKGGKYFLKNILFSQGFSFYHEKRMINMSKDNYSKDTKVYFEITSLKKDRKPFKYLQLSDRQYIKYADREEPLLNSEYKPYEKQITDAYILSIIDCSKSMGVEEFCKARCGMTEILDVITNQFKGPSKCNVKCK